jgi:hypothetical protein
MELDKGNKIIRWRCFENLIFYPLTLQNTTLQKVASTFLCKQSGIVVALQPYLSLLFIFRLANLKVNTYFVLDDYASFQITKSIHL